MEAIDLFFMDEKSYKQHLNEALHFADSYARLPTLLSLAPPEDSPDGKWRHWFSVLGREWSVCDNVGLHAEELRDVFLDHRNQWAQLMTARARAAWNSIPGTLKIFRGCGPNNRLGLSWTTNRETAARFPMLMRYRQDEPLLLTAIVPKERIIALILNRDESEVIALVGEADIRDQSKLDSDAHHKEGAQP